MSDAPSPSPSPSPAPALPGSERHDYRGKCLYKTGKCVNERALKTSGAAHNLCDEHRSRQNQHQRKLDAKHRLTKRERRASGKAPKAERFEPYPVSAAVAAANATADKRRSPSAMDSREVIETETQVTAVPGSVPMPVQASLTTTGLLGLASSTSISSPPVPQPPVLATASNGVMYLPNGPQPPQVGYPFAMQDFDGIVVPLPSYLEGQERVEFRSRIYQKVLDFISEECIRRFGAKVEPTQGVSAPVVAVETLQTPEMNCAGPEAEPRTISETNVTAPAASPSEMHQDTEPSEAEQSSKPATEEPGAASASKKVHSI